MNILLLTSKFPVLFIVIILIILMVRNMKRADKIIQKNRDAFTEREREANATRRKSLETVDYIVIPYEELPMDREKDDETIAECIKQVNDLKGQPIANFTGFTNTDLKLEYGAPNISHLSRCDNDFTILARTLQEWANRLHELGHDDEALVILEYAIKWRSDISSTYYLAAKIYAAKDDNKKIAWLKRQAEGVSGIMGGPILRNLNEKYPDIEAY